MSLSCVTATDLSQHKQQKQPEKGWTTRLQYQFLHCHYLTPSKSSTVGQNMTGQWPICILTDERGGGYRRGLAVTESRTESVAVIPRVMVIVLLLSLEIWLVFSLIVSTNHLNTKIHLTSFWNLTIHNLFFLENMKGGASLVNWLPKHSDPCYVHAVMHEI